MNKEKEVEAYLRGELPEEEKKSLIEDLNYMQEEIENTAQDLPSWEDKQRKESQQLREKFIKAAVKNPIDALRHKHKSHKGAVEFLKNIQKNNRTLIFQPKCG